MIIKRVCSNCLRVVGCRDEYNTYSCPASRWSCPNYIHCPKDNKRVMASTCLCGSCFIYLQERRYEKEKTEKEKKELDS